jgi:hypothetical protein
MLRSRKAIFYIVMLALQAGVTFDARGQSKAARETKQISAPPAKTEPVTSAYPSGEVKITVRGDQHPPIRIAMAPSGITIIEFPATDKFFAVHPPRNGDWVQVEESPSMKSDHHLTLRAGKDLMNSGGPAASFSVQMRSGLIVTFWIYPVKAITQQTHRCIVSYNRDEIVAARRKAGLAVELGEGSEVVAATNVAGDTIPPPPPATATDNKAVPELPSQDAADLEPKKEVKEVAEDKNMVPVASLKKALTHAAQEPKQFKQWTDRSHGISVSVSPTAWNWERTKIALIAIRNTQKDKAITLLPDHPEITVETLNAQGKTLQITPIKKLAQESSTTDNIVPAGSMVFFAIAYAPPILDARQRLRVLVGQTNAADEPVAASLTASVK